MACVGIHELQVIVEGLKDPQDEHHVIEQVKAVVECLGCNSFELDMENIRGMSTLCSDLNMAIVLFCFRPIRAGLFNASKAHYACYGLQPSESAQ